MPDKSSVLDKASQKAQEAISRRMAASILAIFNERNVQHSETLGDNNVLKINIPRSKMIQQIIIRTTIEVTTLTTAPTYHEDSLHAIIQKIELLGDGGEVIRSLTGTLHYFIEKIEKGVAPENVALPAGTATTAKGFVTMIMDFRSNRKDEKDISALLPARRFDELVLQITLGDKDDIASAAAPTINWSNSAVDVDIIEVSGSGIFQTNFADIREAYKEVTMSAAKATFDSDDNQDNVLPIGTQVLAQAILAIDNSVRSDSIITDVMLKRSSPITDEIFKRNFNRLQQENRVNHEIETMVTGFLWIDYRRKLNRALDRKSKIQDLEPNAGDVTLHSLNGSVTATSKYFLFTRWIV